MATTPHLQIPPTQHEIILQRRRRWGAVLLLSTFLFGHHLPALAGQPVHDSGAFGMSEKAAKDLANVLDKARKILDLATSIYNATGARGDGRLGRVLADAGTGLDLVVRSGALGVTAPDRSGTAMAGIPGSAPPNTPQEAFATIETARHWVADVFSDQPGYGGRATGNARRNAALAQAVHTGLSMALATQALSAEDATMVRKLMHLANQAQDQRDQEAVFHLVMVAVNDELATQRRIKAARLEIQATHSQAGMGGNPAPSTTNASPFARPGPGTGPGNPNQPAGSQP